MVTPIGGFFDYEITDEGNPNNDWNPIWDSSTGRFDGGWTVEMEIPFKSLRFRPGVGQIWGLQLGRRIRWKNETVYLTGVPISAGPGMFRLSAAGTLAGVEVPSGNQTFEIKPYAIGSVNSNLTSTPQILNEGAGDGGIDVKYGVTQNLTADFTYNTDFAQVEADEAQLNLSRFNLFFPEKREFFLEGRGIFDFGRAAGTTGGQFRASRLGGSGFFGGGDAPTVFYSRSIGLTGGETVPILGGARLTGKTGRYSIGALNIQTDDVPGDRGGDQLHRPAGEAGHPAPEPDRRHLHRPVGVEVRRRQQRGLRRRRRVLLLRQPQLLRVLRQDADYGDTRLRDHRGQR